MSRLQPYTDDLGYVPGRGSADPVIDDTPPAVPTDRYGLPYGIRAEIEAAIDREDAYPRGDQKLIDEMKATLVAKHKSRLMPELTSIAINLSGAMIEAYCIGKPDPERLRLEYSRSISKFRCAQHFLSFYRGRNPMESFDATVFRAAVDWREPTPNS